MNIYNGALAEPRTQVDPPALPVTGQEALPIVIVGAGPVGRYLAAKLMEQSGQHRVVLFGEEPWEPYDRVQLSSYLAGEIADVAFAKLQGEIDGRFVQHIGLKVSAIDRDNKLVIDQSGRPYSYAKLVLATGSMAFLPTLPGVELDHVYTFRNLTDAHHLKARSVRSRHTVVIGGGLLGLEAARAMCRFNTHVTVIEQAAWPMFNQLDEEVGLALQERVKDSGIDVIVSNRVQAIIGKTSVERIRLADGTEIICDTVIVAAGITPQRQLAVDCDLETHRGVLVNDQLQTSDENIYAVGECAEHRQTIYGLVNPGFERGRSDDRASGV